MQIRFDTDPIGPLRVVPELPGARLAVLEGLNGIGKTLAIRLLQVCTGVMPYSRESSAWASLCQGLGNFTAQVVDLRDGKTIEWVADTRTWQDHADVEELPFKKITVNGKKATLDNVRQLLRVHRIAGDETLIETLAKQADAEEDLVRRWIRSIVSSPDGPVARLESEANDILRVLGEWTTERYTALEGEVTMTKSTVEKLARSSDAADRRLESIQEASELRRRRDDLRQRAPNLRKQLGVVDDEIVAARKDLEEAQKRIVNLAERAAKTQPVLKELRNARRTLDRNRGSLSSALNAAATVAADLALAATREAHDKESQELSERIDELSERQIAMDAAPAMRGLLDEIKGDLIDAEGRGLAKQVALDDPEIDLQLTVNQTRVGIATRRTQLEGQPPPPEAKSVIAELARTHRRLQTLSELEDHLNTADRYARLVKDNEARVDKAMESTDPGALAELQNLQAHRRELDESVLNLAAKRAGLAQQLGALGSETQEVIESRLTASLKEVGISEPNLRKAVEEASQVSDELRIELRQARDHMATVQRELARAEADVRRAIGVLTSSKAFAWLNDALPRVVSIDVEASIQAQLGEIDEARKRVEATMERVGKFRTQAAAVAAALRSVARHLRHEDAEAIEYVPELEEWLGLRFSNWFNSERIRSELLPAADDPIVVDIPDREVRWHEKGRERSRPLEAFSSGEQAFAYTRARLAVLDEEGSTVPNRLIVLDEFGAFIAHDRLTGLLSYLQHRVETHPEDQVLVILPLGRDYASEAEGSVGTQKDEFRKFADQIESQKFAVRVLAR